MKLPERLETIISMVPKCDTAADIGCDHAYVSIALVERGIAKRAIACDINAGPLKHAEENIRTAGVEEKIETRLCDGLSGVKAGEADTVIIAGMGDLRIFRITYCLHSLISRISVTFSLITDVRLKMSRWSRRMENSMS